MDTVTATLEASPVTPVVVRPAAAARALRSWSVRLGAAVLLLLLLASMTAPWLVRLDPTLMDPANRDLLPGATALVTGVNGEARMHRFLMGTDGLGRDLWGRVLYGGRVSLAVGAAVAALSVILGLFFGLLAGYLRRLDLVLMRLMDGVMAIPGILLAVTLVALWGGSLWIVVLAIAVPEVPRVVRLVRSLVLSIREEPYVEAAVSVGTNTPQLLVRHVLPNTLGPLIVQATYICASAILAESILGFLGVGIPPEVPSWGNVMSEGRLEFNEYPHNVFFPGLLITLTILAVNMLGDGLRDTLDPRFSRRGGAR